MVISLIPLMSLSNASLITFYKHFRLKYRKQDINDFQLIFLDIPNFLKFFEFDVDNFFMTIIPGFTSYQSRFRVVMILDNCFIRKCRC